MKLAVRLPNAEAQARFRERRKSERDWLRRELVRLNVEIAKTRVAKLDSIAETADV